MTKLKDIVMQSNKIYSFLYGEYLMTYKPNDSCNKIIEIPTSDLKWSKDEETAYYVWGWPGPDFNRYIRDGFGVTWAFDKEILENYVKQVANE